MAKCTVHNPNATKATAAIICFCRMYSCCRHVCDSFKNIKDSAYWDGYSYNTFKCPSLNDDKSDDDDDDEDDDHQEQAVLQYSFMALIKSHRERDR